MLCENRYSVFSYNLIFIAAATGKIFRVFLYEMGSIPLVSIMTRQSWKICHTSFRVIPLFAHVWLSAPGPFHHGGEPQ